MALIIFYFDSCMNTAANTKFDAFSFGNSIFFIAFEHLWRPNDKWG